MSATPSALHLPTRRPSTRLAADVRPALRRLVEPHLPLQSRLRALLSRRRRRPLVGTENFTDRSELGTEECFRVIDEIAAFAPECVTILTGGEPLLRRDILEIVRRAAERDLWVVVGTNGVRITENVAQAPGGGRRARAVAVARRARSRSSRSLQEGARRVAEHGRGRGDPRPDRLPFIVQTTAGSHNLGELEAIADFAHDRLAAKVWNLYFLVPTGRGQFVSDITPAQYDEVLASLYRIQRKYDGRMLVNAKCAPHYIKTVLQSRRGASRCDPADDRSDSAPWPTTSPIRIYSGGAGGCPAGTHYMGIRPNGDVTPCPYLPVFAGTLRSSTLADLWTSSGLFTDIRRRTSLGGRCGACEMNGQCGGCRARAYGMTGDLMAEDPLCTHVPGHVRRVSPAHVGNPGAASTRRPAVEYGRESSDDHRVGRCGGGADEEDPGVRARDGRQGGRGVLPQERSRPRDRRRARADSRADADAEDLRVGRRRAGGCAQSTSNVQLPTPKPQYSLRGSATAAGTWRQ